MSKIKLEVGDVIEFTMNFCGCPIVQGDRACIVGIGKEGERYARLFITSYGRNSLNNQNGGEGLITVNEENAYDYFIKCEGKIEKYG